MVAMTMMLLVAAVTLGISFYKKNMQWRTEKEVLEAQMKLLEEKHRESFRQISMVADSGDVPIGLLEINRKQEQAFCSRQAIRILGWDGSKYECFQEKRYLIRELRKLKDYLEPGQKILKIPMGEQFRWVELRIKVERETVIGVAVDVTGIILAKHRVIYERDYDMLTGIYNRQTFLSQLSVLFEDQEALRWAALMKLDLNALKLINDDYGHSSGDDYICAMANVLKSYQEHRGVFARNTGDEFFGFFYGYDSKAELEELINQLWSDIGKTTIPLPDGHSTNLKTTAAIAWYPQDSRDLDKLLSYVNFKLYVAKRSEKGKLLSFSREQYEREGFLLNAREAFNQMVSQQLVYYAFQPIVAVNTGKIYGYEMLLRPMIPELKSPMQVLEIARAQSRLYEVEQITWFKAMQTYVEQIESGRISYDTKVFINSIGGTVIRQEEQNRFFELYYDYLKNIVLELTEEDQENEDCLITKRNLVKQWNAQIAIDDYGSGYNSEVSLLYFQPNLVKVDMSIIHNIDQDTDRQKLLENLVGYAKQRDIAVLAEGIETKEEMDTVIARGVDYMQGYYLGKPEAVPKSIPAKIVRQIGISRWGDMTNTMKSED